MMKCFDCGGEASSMLETEDVGGYLFLCKTCWDKRIKDEDIDNVVQEDAAKEQHKDFITLYATYIAGIVLLLAMIGILVQMLLSLMG